MKVFRGQAMEPRPAQEWKGQFLTPRFPSGGNCRKTTESRTEWQESAAVASTFG
jgi:hypothetical protein